MIAFANGPGIVSSVLSVGSRSPVCSRTVHSFTGTLCVTSRRTSFTGASPLVNQIFHDRNSHVYRHRRLSGTPQMSLKKVVVAGGTGFVGTRLVRALVDKGADVTVLTRSQGAADHLPAKVSVQQWTPNPSGASGNKPREWEECLEGSDLVVNLCGVPIVTRWSEAGKRAIRDSRVKTNENLAKAIQNMSQESRPKCFVSASGVGYYGVSDDAVFTEESSAAKNDFLADVSVAWENAAKPVADAGVRLVVLRFGVVMGVGGGALARMLPAFKMFLGGPVGSGNQWVSWIHIDDLVRMIIRAGEDSSISGALNATAPSPVTMGELSAALARALNRPNMFPVPDFVLKTLLGESASVVLSGQQVLPKRWQENNFEFAHPDIDSAMKAVAKEA